MSGGGKLEHYTYINKYQIVSWIDKNTSPYIFPQFYCITAVTIFYTDTFTVIK